MYNQCREEVKSSFNLFINPIPAEWKEYLTALLETVNLKHMSIDWDYAAPLPIQLRNPSIILRKLEDDGVEELTYLISQIWLLIMEDGTNQIIIPEETSGSMMDFDTKEVISNFNGLPSIVPSGVKHMLRVVITKSTSTSVENMGWTLYSK